MWPGKHTRTHTHTSNPNSHRRRIPRVDSLTTSIRQRALFTVLFTGGRCDATCYAVMHGSMDLAAGWLQGWREKVDGSREVTWNV